MRIGGLVFPGIDQMDVTGPFEVLARTPGAKFDLVWKELTPVRDGYGLVLTPGLTFADVDRLDVLVVPGGRGQLALMEDEEVLQFLREAAERARYVLSVCTGALTLGAAGLLRGRRATTHWNSVELLPLLGADRVDERVVVDGTWVFAAGVSAGIDGALRLVALMHGEEMAQRIQFNMEYEPERVPAAIQQIERKAVQSLTDKRRAAAERAMARLNDAR